jgi:hypothetical protein
MNWDSNAHLQYMSSARDTKRYLHVPGGGHRSDWGLPCCPVSSGAETGQKET